MDSKMQANQDNCLLNMEAGLTPSMMALTSLPPWRAVMIARIAERCGIMTEDEVAALVEGGKKRRW